MKPTTQFLAVSLLVSIVALVVASCGGSSSSPTAPSTPTLGPVVDTTTITIGSGGVVSPNNIRVAVGNRVTMVNNDSRVHDMNSDPHPAHTTCPAINWGNIQPGQSVQSQVLSSARACSYHDHNLPDNASLKGSIQIQ